MSDDLVAFWLEKLERAREERLAFEEAWIDALKFAARTDWLDWLTGSVEAGRCLTSAAEVVEFARQAQQRLHQDDARDESLLCHFLERQIALLHARVEKPRRREALAADELVEFRLEWPALALRFHPETFSRLWAYVNRRLSTARGGSDPAGSHAPASRR